MARVSYPNIHRLIFFSSPLFLLPIIFFSSPLVSKYPRVHPSPVRRNSPPKITLSLPLFTFLPLPSFPMTSCSTTLTPLPSSLLLRGGPQPPLHSSLFLISPSPRPFISRRGFSCQVALSSDTTSSITSEEEAEAAEKIGKKVRVTVPLKVYHVNKVPDLDLCGMEGVIKQYVGIWKGKRITANLPFKVEFFVSIEGQDKPVKVLAHVKEDEFEYI